MLVVSVGLLQSLIYLNSDRQTNICLLLQLKEEVKWISVSFGHWRAFRMLKLVLAFLLLILADAELSEIARRRRSPANARPIGVPARRQTSAQLKRWSSLLTFTRSCQSVIRWEVATALVTGRSDGVYLPTPTPEDITSCLFLLGLNTVGANAGPNNNSHHAATGVSGRRIQYCMFF